jgi:hypothetical protein
MEKRIILNSNMSMWEANLPVTVRNLINIPVSTDAQDWAIKTATQKCLYSIHGFLFRNLPTIFQNIFQGDLAKSAFIEWLNSRRITQIWEFDRHRTDGFRGWNRLGYQLLVTRRNGREVKIDVNSSVPTRGERNDAIVNERDIKVTAGKRRGPITEPTSLRADVFVQIYVRPRVALSLPTAREIHSSLSQRGEIATRQLLDVNRAYSGNILTGFAWATRADINRFKRNHERRGDQTTWQFWGSHRIYWHCPIRESRKMVDLPSHLR